MKRFIAALLLALTITSTARASCVNDALATARNCQGASCEAALMYRLAQCGVTFEQAAAVARTVVARAEEPAIRTVQPSAANSNIQARYYQAQLEEIESARKARKRAAIIGGVIGGVGVIAGVLVPTMIYLNHPVRY